MGFRNAPKTLGPVHACQSISNAKQIDDGGKGRRGGEGERRDREGRRGGIERGGERRRDREGMGGGVGRGGEEGQGGV